MFWPNPFAIRTAKTLVVAVLSAIGLNSGYFKSYFFCISGIERCFCEDMDESRDPKQTGPYSPGLSSEYGVYDGTAGYQSFPRWTQFSGIPSANNTGYQWEPAFANTPPSTPGSAGVNMDPSNPYFSQYSDVNMMHGLGRTSPMNFDADPREADSAMLASTPLAQSLIEASLNSPNPLLTPLPDGSFPMPPTDTMDFQDASQNGYEIYAEALKKLENFPSYNPFGTSDVLNSSSSPPTPPVELDNSANAKPSYSDVAKTLKNSQSSGGDKGETDNLKKKNYDSTNQRSFKSNKKFTARPIRGRNNSVPDDMTTTVSPDSKYGLDAFDDLGQNKSEKDETQKTMDLTPPLIRKNSTSSVSSGTSGIEEIHLPKTCNLTNSNEDPTNLDKIQNSSEKTNTFDGNLNDSGKPFFDATRIFQSKDTNKRRSTSKVLDEDNCDSTILNNGKPASWCSASAHKKTNYINNNLRDSQKKTNQNPVGSSRKPSSDNIFSQANGRPDKSRMRNSSSKSDSSPSAKPGVPVQTSFDQELIGKLV